MRRIVCLRLNDWPVARLRAERPKLRGRTLVVRRPDPRRGEAVAACDESARRAGVRPGMPLAEAAVLLARGRQEPAIVSYDPAADRAALGRLAVRCDRFSPLVGWETVTPRAAFPWYGDAPDHLLLDITGVAHLFGGDDELARQLVAEFQKLGLSVRVAVADTVGAAWALTEAEGSQPGALATESPSLALRADAELGPLPVSSLRLPVDVLHTLGRLGVFTIDQLLQLPRSGLAERFGSVIQVRIDQAFGTAGEVIVPYRPAPDFVAHCQLEVPTDRREVIEWLLAGLTERIAEELHTHGVGAVRLAGRLDCGEPVKFTVGLFRPSESAKQLQELLRLQLERLTLPGPVAGIRLCADLTAPLVQRQGELFADPASQTNADLAALLERLSSRLGAAAVVRPELCADPLPERAVRYVPAVGRRRSTSSAKPPAAVSHRPLRLFTPPPLVEAVALTPDGPPVSFRWEGRQHVIARHVGPERIETGWWRRGIVRRDYYRTETDGGERFWLFRDLSAGRWHLHGSFE